ncbi:MAG: HAD family hydrolase [Solirubrobacterales bacterium]|nr:HAD family hydrolase [Solirubrobacterales bacterium]
MAVAILDIDGTLVDTNYQHTESWFRAFLRHEIVLPMWQIHRRIGMGGDQVVGSLCGEGVESEHGDSLRAAEADEYGALIGEVQVMDGARRLLQDLKQRGHTVVLASSAKTGEVDHYLDLLDARDLADGWTTSADVEATKPHPDLVGAALDKVDGQDQTAIMIGDTPWDIAAARQLDVGTLAVMTGGFAESELRDAGALAVFESVADLDRRLGETPLG